MSASQPHEPGPPGRSSRLALAGVCLVASVVAALWVAHTVGAPGAFGGGGAARYDITAERGSPESGEVGDGRLSFYRLLADGQIEPLDVLAKAPTWRADTLAAGAPAGIRLAPGSPAGTVSIRAESFLLTTRSEAWSGWITVRRDGVPVRQVAVGRNDSNLVLDANPTPAMAWPIGLAILLMGFLAVSLRPWWGGVRATRWLAVVLAGVHLCYWCTMAVGTTNDTPEYVLEIDTLRAGVPGYFPPGYTAFLGVVRWLTGAGYPLWVTLLQHAMLVAAALWLHRLLRRLVGEAFALGGAFVAGTLAASLALPQAIMSETPALFATVGALWFTIRVCEDGHARHASVAGILLGWAGLLRVVPMLAVAPVATYLLVTGSRRRTRQLVVLLGVAVAMVAAPIGWFALRSGTPALANSSALHLYNRVVMEQRLLDASGSATRQLLASLGGEDPRGLPWWDVWSRPRATGLEDADLQRAMGGAAKEGIRSAPVAFALYTPRLAWRELFAEASGLSPDWSEAQVHLAELDVPPLLSPTAVGLRWRWTVEALARRAWPVIGVLSLLGLLVAPWHPRRTLVIAIGSVTMLKLLGSATLEAFDSRYNFSVSALLVALAMVCLDALTRLPGAARQGELRAVARATRGLGSATIARIRRLAPGAPAEGLPAAANHQPDLQVPGGPAA